MNQIFNFELNKLDKNVRDDHRQDILKHLQTYYVASYMKIMIELKSPNNTLFNQGYMTENFISHFYN